MLPSFSGKKTKKAEEKAKKEMEAAEERERERKARVNQVLESRGGNYYDEQQAYQNSSSSSSKSKKKDKNAPHDPWADRSPAYSTPAGMERDDKEVEIDSNLDQISNGLSRLKMMGMTMNQEIETQNDHIRRIDDKTSTVKDRVDGLNRNLNKISGKKK
jgi:septal ring factor EnvC (AmiA/AmiB activator)